MANVANNDHVDTMLSAEELESFGFQKDETAVKIEFDYDKIVNYHLLSLKILTFIVGVAGFIIMFENYSMRQSNYEFKIFLSIFIGIMTFGFYLIRSAIISNVKSNQAAISHDQMVFRRGGCSCCFGIFYNESIKSISLTKITDISIKQDCCLKYYNLKSLSLDTASGCEGTLIGVRNIEYIRKVIMRTKQVIGSNNNGNVNINSNGNDKLLMTSKNNGGNSQNELLLQLMNKMDNVCNLLTDIKQELRTQNSGKDKSESDSRGN